MSEKAASAYVNEFEGHLVGSVQVELTESVLDNFREHLLEAVQRTRPMGVIIDVSAVPFMDVQEFAQLRRILRLGLPTVIDEAYVELCEDELEDRGVAGPF